MSEKEFKVKELERLLDEKEITLDQYLEMRTKMEKMSNHYSGVHENRNCEGLSESSNMPLSSHKVVHEDLRKGENRSFLETDIAIALSPLFILVGIGLMWSEMSSVQTHGLVVYPYFYPGLLLSAVGMFFLMGGLIRHVNFKRTRSSAECILLGGVGVFLAFFGVVILWQTAWVVNQINSLAFTVYYVSVSPWAQGLLGLGMLAGGIFMIVVGLIRGSSNTST